MSDTQERRDARLLNWGLRKYVEGRHAYSKLASSIFQGVRINSVPGQGVSWAEDVMLSLCLDAMPGH